jgi:hypothetical protein
MYYSSRGAAQAAKIADAQVECEKAQLAYRRGEPGAVDRMNKCNRALGAAHAEYRRIQGGIAPDYDSVP